MKLSSMWLDCAFIMWSLRSVLGSVDPIAIKQFSIRVDFTVSDEPTTNFLPFCCNLRALGFIDCTSFDDKYFHSVSQHSPHVVHLDISFCTWLTDNIANDLVQGMPQLRMLNISGTKLSDVFLNTLAVNYSHSLQALYASNCGKLWRYPITSTFPALHTMECSCYGIVASETLNNITTLILANYYLHHLAVALEWVQQHGEHLEHLRVVSNASNLLNIGFEELTVETLPNLRTVSVCALAAENEYDFELPEPESLRKLRAVRPSLRVYYNTDELAYDLFKLPV